jgi:hypothetical protein
LKSVVVLVEVVDVDLVLVREGGGRELTLGVGDDPGEEGLLLLLLGSQLLGDEGRGVGVETPVLRALLMAHFILAAEPGLLILPAGFVLVLLPFPHLSLVHVELRLLLRREVRGRDP